MLLRRIGIVALSTDQRNRAICRIESVAGGVEIEVEIDGFERPFLRRGALGTERIKLNSRRPCPRLQHGLRPAQGGGIIGPQAVVEHRVPLGFPVLLARKRSWFSARVSFAFFNSTVNSADRA